MMRLCFLTPRRGNHFMTELLEALAGAVRREGVATSMVTDQYSEWDPETAWVLIPHEFFDQAPRGGIPTERHLQRTVGVCVEHPGTPWFERTCLHGQRLGALVDIRREGVRELRRRGLAADHLQLGYAPEWDRWQGEEAGERQVDVVFLGASDARRERVLAGYGQTLWTRSARVLIPPTSPKPGGAPDFLIGAEKHALLASASTLLNVHRERARGVEWVRVLEAITNGCVVVSEHSLDWKPLCPGEHLLVGRAENLARLADRLLDDPERLAQIRRHAYDFIRTSVTMGAAAQRLIAAAEKVIAQPIGYPEVPHGPMPDPPLPPQSVPDPWPPPFEVRVGAALRRIELELGEMRRQLSPRRGAGTLELACTSKGQRALPRVTVGISLYNYEREIGHALQSAVASDFVDFEVIVVDDGSDDGSSEAALSFLANHDRFAIRVLAHDGNRGPGPTRNTIIEHARGELIFMLDADNVMFPSALPKLVAALEADPAAAFAYGMLAFYQDGRPTQLVSHRPWDPQRLRNGNEIDAMALIRRTALHEVGGYAVDRRLAGHEDYDLWCRIADQDGHGVLVPEIVGRYHRTRHSLLAMSLIDTSAAMSLIRARAPRLWADRARKSPPGP